MLKRVVIVNHLGESMEYAIEGFQADNNPSGLLITSIEGLGPGKATVNTTEIPTSDGGIVNSVRLSGKNIVIKFKFTGVTSVEEARLLSYRTFPIKKKVTFYIETDNREAAIDGYVESNEPVVFSKDCEMQVSILCESAYFLGEEIESVLTTSGVTIPYYGDTDNGMGIIINMPAATMASISRATDISITSGSDTLKLNTSKIAFAVENTAASNVNLIDCILTFDDDNVRYLGSLPNQYQVPFPTVSPDTAGNTSLFPVLIDNELHYFGIHTVHDTESGTDICKGDYILHYKVNLEDRTVVRLDNVGYDNDYSNNLLGNLDGSFGRWRWGWLVNYNNKIYLYTYSRMVVSGPGVKNLFEYNIELNKFEPSNDFKLDFPDGGTWAGFYAVVYNNKLHITTESVYGSGSQSGVSMHGYIYDGTTSTLSPDQSFSEDCICDFMVVYDGKIHSFYERDHYEWNGTLWTKHEDELPSGCSGVHPSCVFNNCVYFINSGKDLYKYDGTNYTLVMDLSEKIPDYRYLATVGSLPPLGVIGDSMYIFGRSRDTDDTYTEDPNNVCLIENDVVTVTTYKGKKAITLYRGGYAYNIINALDRSSKWLQLDIGNNLMSYSAETGASDLEVTVTSNELYGGV